MRRCEALDAVSCIYVCLYDMIFYGYKDGMALNMDAIWAALCYGVCVRMGVSI